MSTAVELPVRVRVMIVDDEPDMRFMMSLNLGYDARFEVVGVAANGRQAVEQCHDLSPDLIVLDVRMPRLDGLAALPMLRHQCPGAKIAFFTAFGEEVDFEPARLQGAAVFEKSDPLLWLLDRLYELALQKP